MDYDRNLKKIIEMILLATVVAITPLLFSLEAIKAAASNTKLAMGWGTGTLTCSNGLVLNNEHIHFESYKSKGGAGGLTSGNWSISASNVPAINTNHGPVHYIYVSKLQHILVVGGKESQGTVCKAGSGVSTNDVTISGQCGTGMTISFANLIGDKGTFKGTIVCNLINGMSP